MRAGTITPLRRITPYQHVRNSLNTETGELLPPHDATLIPTEPPPPPQPSTLHKIFIGKDGLRAGWSLLYLPWILAVLVVAVNVIGHKFFPHNPKVANDASVITIKVGVHPGVHSFRAGLARYVDHVED